ncbi:MAG: TPM domain-containing protein [Cyanobacteria bacterium P01_A01_bin.84]
MKRLLSKFKKTVQITVLLLFLFVGITAFTTPALATGIYDVPNFDPNSWVIDQGEVLSLSNESKVSNILEDIAERTGNEVRVVTIRRLDYGETAESFTKALFKKWFPDTEAQANQTILMLDSVTNNSAIITGDRSGSLLSDEIAQSVASETLLIPLRNGNKYNQAFLDASDRLNKVLSGEPDPGPPEIVNTAQVGIDVPKLKGEEKGNAIAWIIGLLIAATVIPMATYYIYLAIQPSSEGET